MTKRDVVKLAFQFQRPPYVPWHFSFTQPARAKLVEQPRLPAARAALAENLTRAERIPEALEVLREGAELMPDDPEAVGNYSLLLVQVGGSEFRSKYDAVEMLEKLCERGGYADPQALFRLATVYLLIARTDEAQAMAERALTLATDTGNEELIAVINNLITNVARAKEAQLAAPPGQPGGQTP